MRIMKSYHYKYNIISDSHDMFLISENKNKKMTPIAVSKLEYI